MTSDPFTKPPKWPAPKPDSAGLPRLETKRESRRRALQILLIVGATVLVVGGIAVLSAVNDVDDDRPDAAAQTACRHFRNVAADYSDGVLTVDELRSKLREIDRDASASNERGIAVNARAMLAGITTGTDDELGSAVRLFGSSCSALGL